MHPGQSAAVPSAVASPGIPPPPPPPHTKQLLCKAYRATVAVSGIWLGRLHKQKGLAPETKPQRHHCHHFGTQKRRQLLVSTRLWQAASQGGWGWG